MGVRHADPIDWPLLQQKCLEHGITGPTQLHKLMLAKQGPGAPGRSTLIRIFSKRHEATAAGTVRRKLEDFLGCSLLANPTQLSTDQAQSENLTNEEREESQSIDQVHASYDYTHSLDKAIREHLSPKERIAQVDTLHQQGELRIARLLARNLYMDLRQTKSKTSQTSERLLAESALWYARTNMSLGYARRAMRYISEAIRRYDNIHDPESNRNNASSQLANAHHTLHSVYRIAEDYERAGSASQRALEHADTTYDPAERNHLKQWLLEDRSTLLAHARQFAQAYKSGNRAVEISMGAPGSLPRIRPATFIRAAEAQLQIAMHASKADQETLIKSASELLQLSHEHTRDKPDGWAMFLYARTMYLFHKSRHETEQARDYLEIFFNLIASKRTSQVHHQIYIMREIAEWPDACPECVIDFLRNKYDQPKAPVERLAREEEARLIKIRNGR